MNKSNTRNKYMKWSSTENFLAMKRAKSYCNNLTRTTKKNFFQNVSKNSFANNKKFWNSVKKFLTNKGYCKNTSRVPPVIQGNANNPNEDNTTVKNIIKQYQYHIRSQ